MLTDEERKALVANKVRRSRETWAEAKGIMEMDKRTTCHNDRFLSGKCQ